MTILQSLVLGLIQGITEFLPVSSSGHLILMPYLFHWDIQDLSFDIMLHFGTTLAVIVFFYDKWILMIKSVIHDVVFSGHPFTSIHKNLSFQSKTFLIIMLSALPVAFAGYLFDDFIEANLRSPLLVSIMLVLIAVFMFISEKVYEKGKFNTNPSFKDYFIISISQILAMIPGTSRSGISISTGLLRNVEKGKATEISFLLATPLILGAFVLKLPDLLELTSVSYSTMLVGLLTSFLSGILGIKILMEIVKRVGLLPFVIYRILLGLIVISTFYIFPYL